MDPHKQRSWRTMLRGISASRGRRAEPGRADGAMRLGVEALESRTLLSASTGYPTEAWGATAWPSHEPPPHVATSMEFNPGGLEQHVAAPHALVGYGGVLADGPPHFDGRHFDSGTSHDGERLVVQSTVVVFMNRVDAPDGNGASRAPISNQTFNDIESPRQTSQMKPNGPMAARAAPEGNEADAPRHRAVADGARVDVSFERVAAPAPSPFVGAAEIDAANDADAASPLLRALESRDAVFQALAARGATMRSGDVADSLFTPAELRLRTAREANSTTGEYLMFADDESMSSLSLRDVTDDQIRAVRDVLDDLEARARDSARRGDRPATPGDGAPDEALLPPDEAAVVAAAVYEGGMVLINPGAAANGQFVALEEGRESDDGGQLAGAIDMEAEVSFLQAFAVASDEAPAGAPAVAQEARRHGEAATPSEKSPEDASTNAGKQTALPGIAVGAGMRLWRRRRARGDRRPLRILVGLQIE